jgi:hypothetical protein
MQENTRLLLYRMDQSDANASHILDILQRVEDRLTKLVADRAEDATKQAVLTTNLSRLQGETRKVTERVDEVEKQVVGLRLENAKRIAISSFVGGGAGGLIVFAVQAFDLLRLFHGG